MDQLDPYRDAPPASGEQLIKELSIPLFEAKGWLRLVGVLSIISGIITIFTIWGILVCWIPIWVGILLMRAASAAEIAQINGDKAQLNACLRHLRTYFTLQGIFTLIGIIVAVISLVIAGGTFLSLLPALSESF